MSIATMWTEFKTWWDGTSFGQEIDAAGKATLAELEAIAPATLEGIVSSTSTALLTGLAAESPTADIISAGITAAEAAFKAAGASVSATTISTFTSTLHSSVVAQQTAGAVTPAPTPEPTPPVAA